MIYLLLSSILQQFIDWDTQFLLGINSCHSPFFDTLMYWISNKWLWVPMYVLLAVALFRVFGWRKALICLLVIALMITTTDQMVSTLIRPEIARLRPANLSNPISPLVHVVNGYRSGKYGFPSAHAANSWALAVFLMLVFRRRWFTGLMLFWALLVCYSRAYLGVHYPGDLFVGSVLGALVACIFYFLMQKLYCRYFA